MAKDEIDDEVSIKDAPSEEEETEDSFMDGYTNEDEVQECAECGSAVREAKKVVASIEGEEYTFCSKACAEEFKETFAAGEEE